MADGFGSLAPDQDWMNDPELAAGYKYVREKELADEAAKRTWGDTLAGIGRLPQRVFGSLAATPVPEPADEATQLYFPEASYVNPIAKGALDAAGAAIKSGVTAPGDALHGDLQLMDPVTGRPTDEGVRRLFDTAALAGGASVARTAASETAAPYHALLDQPAATLASDSGRPGGMIANVDQLKELANQRRARGWATGQSAPGWDFKRPDPEIGTPERAAAEARAATEAARPQPESPLMTQDDRDFIASGGFYSDTAKPGAAVSIAERLDSAAKPYHDLLEGTGAGAYKEPHETSPHAAAAAPSEGSEGATATQRSAEGRSSANQAGLDERRGLAEQSGGGGSLRQAELQAGRRAGSRSTLPGLPVSPQLVNGEPFIPGPVARAHDVAERYMADKDFGRYFQPPDRYHQIDPEHSTAIAKAFEDMKHTPDDPATKAAYAALVKETRDQYRAIRASGLRLTPTDASTYPYHGNPRAVAKDVADNNHMAFFKTDAGFGSDPASGIDLKSHPMMQPSGETLNGQPLLNNDLFRIVHDYFGHIKNGYGFRAAGEDNAFRAHAAMYSDLARPAMATETRGQNSWVNYGPHGEKNRTASGADTVYADQKVGLMPEWTMRDRGSLEPIRTYQGSPSAHSQIDMSRIGTGEGSAARGHGMYSAESPAIARDYRYMTAIRQDPLAAKMKLTDFEKLNLGRDLGSTSGDPGPVIEDLQNHIENLKAKQGEGDTSLATANMIKNSQKMIRYLNHPDRAQGHMYELGIDRPEDHFIDWEKPLKEQSQYVQDKLRPILEARRPEMAKARAYLLDRAKERLASNPSGAMRTKLERDIDRYSRPVSFEDMPGEKLYEMSAHSAMGKPPLNAEEGHPISSQFLRAKGIAGLKYRAGTNFNVPRGAEGSSNYVTFDAPRILKRYAIPATSGAVGFGSLAPGQEQQ